MSEPILSVTEFYTGVAAYMARVDPTWLVEQWQAQVADEENALRARLGEGQGRAVLDCSCGSGGQAIPLAKLGWRVTATDITQASLQSAREHAREAQLSIDFRTCDMRHLDTLFSARFDWAISCMALDNILADTEIQQAINGMFQALRPGGRLYLRLRNFDTILREKPRYEFREERHLAHGRVIRLEDWSYVDELHPICIFVFLHEDRRRTGYAWTTETFCYRRRAVRGQELEQLLQQAGFTEITFLAHENLWRPYEVMAQKPG